MVSFVTVLKSLIAIKILSLAILLDGSREKNLDVEDVKFQCRFLYAVTLDTNKLNVTC